MTRLKKRLLLAGSLLTAGCVAAGIAYATIPSEGVITGCYQKSNGALRVIGTNPTVGGGACTNGEQPLNWNQIGSAGATGATGATGPSGSFAALHEVSGSTVTVQPHAPFTAAATCPMGETAVSGGWVFEAYDTDAPLTVVDSLRSPASIRTWAVQAYNPSATVAASLRAIAYCAPMT